MRKVDFYYSIGSRYSYLAASQLERLQADTGCAFEWHPLNSVRLLAARENNPFDGKPGPGPYEWCYREQDAKRWAAYYGVTFVEPRGRVEFDSELLALACTTAKRLGSVQSFSQQLFGAMFGGGVDKIDKAECIARATLSGLDASQFIDELRSHACAQQLCDTMDSAKRLGVFGVPTFIVDNELFWGNDRLVLLERYLLTERS